MWSVVLFLLFPSLLLRPTTHSVASAVLLLLTHTHTHKMGAIRKLWSLKEAFVKATGEGLGFDLGKAEFELDGNAGVCAWCEVCCA